MIHGKLWRARMAAARGETRPAPEPEPALQDRPRRRPSASADRKMRQLARWYGAMDPGDRDNMWDD